jgi:rhodanese-related sulfurtransferase
MHSACQLPLEITVAEVQKRLGGVALIDVREPDEHAIARMEGAELIPMGAVPQHLAHLEGVSDEKDLIVLCHHGVRSLIVAQWLREHGIENAQSMQGGIDAWSRLIDTTIPRY